MLTRRRLLQRVSALAGLATLAACSAPPTSPPVPSPTQPPATVAATSLAATAPPPSKAAVNTVVPTATALAPRLVVATATSAAVATPTQPANTIAAVGRRLPLFDTHLHYSQDAWDAVPIDRALALLDAVGTRQALLSSTPDEGTLRLYRAAPDRIIPILRPYRSRDDMGSWHNDSTIPAYLQERLSLGVHRGLGEFHVYGDAAASPVMAQVARLATERGLLLHAHADEAAVAHLFAHQPAARVLWAHAGFVGPEAVREMVDRFSGLSVEFAFRGDIAPGGRLAPGWRALIERYPERFMIGTDTYIPARWAAMPAILAEVSAWLMTLPPALADAVAWRNAARLLGVDEAAFVP